MYTKDAMKPVVEHVKQNLSSKTAADAFNDADQKVKFATATAFRYIEHSYPQLAKQADARPVDNPLSSKS